MPTADADEARGLFLAIGREIRHARGKRTADSLGQAIGKDQTTISTYERGGTVPLPVLWAIEDELGLRRGELQVRARAVAPEVVPSATPTEQAINNDGRLDGPAKETMLYAYRYCVSVSKPSLPDQVSEDIAAAHAALDRAEKGISEPPSNGGPDRRRTA